MFEAVVKIQNKYLFFPVNNNAEKRKVWVSQQGRILYDLDLRLAEKADYLTWLNVEDKIGEEICFSCEENGIVGLIYQGDDLPEGIYHEKYRPYFHFSPLRGWVNDPNGLVYANGKYHIFYQHNPYDTRWGNMHWGHSHSDDLFHWTDDGEALFPDTDGTMFSGCAVYDKENVSGLGSKTVPPILLFYTCAGGDNAASAGKPFTICLAYSTDDGKTFKKYEKNPLIENIVFGNRDPKVIWDSVRKKWIMVLFLQPYDFAFLSSENLFDWKTESVGAFPTMNECPNFFPLEGTEKWVMLSGADYWGDKSVGKYVLGDFDGRTFTTTDGPYPVDFGKEFYSLQTFDNDPYGRQVLVGWRTRNFFMPAEKGMPFNGEYSVPTELTPCIIEGKLRLARYPVKEFFDLPGKMIFKESGKTYDAHLRDVRPVVLKAGESFSVELSFRPKDNAIAVFDIAGEKIIYHTETLTLQCFEKNLRVLPEDDGSIRLLILRDVVSLEVFAQRGKYPASGYFEPRSDEVTIDIYRGTVEDFSCEIKAIYGVFDLK